MSPIENPQRDAAPGAASTRISCDDGWVLDVALRLPEGTPRAVAICGHAMMVDRRTLDVRGDGLVSSLARAGLAVVWPDLRGHGKSGPLASDGGRWSYDDLVEQDTPALHAFARSRFPGLRTFAVGHSLFAHVSVAHLARHSDAAVDGLVMFAGNVWLPACEPSRLVRLEKRAAIESMWAAARVAGRFPARALRIGNTDESADYVAQFHDWITSGDWRARDGFSWWRAMTTIRRPVLSIAGAGDGLFARPGCVERFSRHIPGAEYHWAGRARRGAVDPGMSAADRLPLDFDPDHMGLVTDPRSRPLWEEAARWILAHA